jgi:hypothetical protein
MGKIHLDLWKSTQLNNITIDMRWDEKVLVCCCKVMK